MLSEIQAARVTRLGLRSQRGLVQPRGRSPLVSRTETECPPPHERLYRGDRRKACQSRQLNSHRIEIRPYLVGGDFGVAVQEP